MYTVRVGVFHLCFVFFYLGFYDAMIVWVWDGLYSMCKKSSNQKLQFKSGRQLYVFHFFFIARNGRPGTSSISEKHKIDWGTYMSSRNDVIYIRLDVRGSKGQSKKALYRHLGGAEVQDQIDALR